MRPSIDYQQHARYLAAGGVYLRVLQEAGYITRCSGNKTAALLRPIRYAIRHSYIRMNRPDIVSWLLFDLDHFNAWIWSSAGLPAPNLIVRDPETGKSHLAYAIKPVLTGAGARDKPQKYLRAVWSAYCLALQADTSYRGPMFKTPGHMRWDTTVLHERVYDLGELAQYVELEKKFSGAPRESKHSRNCILFDEARYYAYEIVERERTEGSFERFMGLVAGYAADRNNFRARGTFSDNLRASEVKATVKSVARWTWDNYFGGRRCRRGIMHLSDELSLKEKQRMAAQHTHGLQHQSSTAKILAACAVLKSQSAALTLSAVAKAAGLARQTVAKYRHLLAAKPAEVQPSSTAGAVGAPAAAPAQAPARAATATSGVNFGGCQISGALCVLPGTPFPVVEVHPDDG